MFRNILQFAEDLHVLSVVGLIFFFGFFVFVLIRVWRMDKTFVKKMASMPLEQKSPAEIYRRGQNNGQ